MSKLRRDLSVVLAGACCGLFGVSVFLLADRVNSYYAYLGWLQEGPSDFRYDRGVETLSWVSVVLWHMVLSVTAALMVHRYQANSRVSPFLRWQAIGLVSLFGWGATILAIVGAETLMSGRLPVLGNLSWIKLIGVFQFIAAVFASNVLFGSAVQAASSDATREHNQARPSVL